MACVRMRVTDGSVLDLIQVVNLREAESLDFLGFTFRYDRDLIHYTREQMVVHLNRRSQRKYHRPQGMSHYQYLQALGLLRP